MSSEARSTIEVSKRIEQVLSRPKRKTVTVLSCLIDMQDAFGFIPPDAIPAVAERMDSSVNDVYGVVTFYTHFRLQPPTKHTVEVCWGPACHVVGAAEIMKVVEDELGVDGEGDTSQGECSLRRNSCAGACAQGPVMLVDHQIHGRLTPDGSRDLVRPLKRSA